MALFKQLRGNRAALNSQPLTDGYAYFCVDDGTFHIDFTDENGTLQRKQINAKDAETLGGFTIDDILSNDEVYIGDGEMPENATIQLILDAEDEEQVFKDEFTEYIDSEIDKVVYIGDDEVMPETAKIQFVLGDTDETELIENQFKNYIDSELTRAKNSGEFKGDPGQNGDPGYTPVKGVDYWTAADQQAMVEAVLNALPIGEEAVF